MTRALSMLTPVCGLAVLVAGTATCGARATPSTDTRVATLIAADREQVAQPQGMLQQSTGERQVAASTAAATPAQPPSIPDIIRAAFAPLGPDAVAWGLRIGYCESTYNPEVVNPSSGTEGLFQFQPSTWAGTPEAGASPFDATANAQAAAWLFSTVGPDQWECQ